MHVLKISMTILVSSLALQDLSTLKKYEIQPTDLHDIPASVDLSQNYLFDDAAPRASLGLGVSEIEIAVALQRHKAVLPASAACASIPPALPSAAGCDEPAKTAPVIPAPVPSQEAAPDAVPKASGRVLVARPSDEGLDEAGAAEQIAENCKIAFQNCQWSSDDPLDSGNVAFWMRRFVEHISEQFRSSGLGVEECLVSK